VQQHWSVSNKQPVPASGRDSTEQACFDLDCGQCTTQIQIKTACKNLQTCFECRVHGSKARSLSAPQLAALAVLQKLPGIGSITVEQFRVLPLMQKPIDMVIEQYGMLVELDGRQHEQEQGAFGEVPGSQYDRDRQLDRLVLASGRRLLRLH
jgi:hypothetical protein